MSVTIYGSAHPAMACTLRTLFTAFELGHPVNLVDIDFTKGEHKQPAHLARQPFGKIPAAQDGDLIFYESRAICRYLVDKYASDSAIKLVPSDIKERAIFEQWMSLESTTYTPEITTILINFLGAKFRGVPMNEEACKKALDNLLRDGAVLNKQLDGKTWIVNDHFSLVDICLLTYIVNIAETPEIKEWFTSYPNIGAWYKNVTARPAWQKVVEMGQK
jgi:glutathione S-transferase